MDYELTEARKKRDLPCLVSSIGRKQTLGMLESLLKLWPLRDLRYNNEDMPGYESTDTAIMIDLAKGMEFRTLKRDLVTGVLDTAIELQSNLGEFERYNLYVADHNSAWFREGCPETTFDPVHGEVRKIRDQFVDPAVISSSFNPQPDSVYEKKVGKIAKARPEMKRSAYIRVTYQLSHTKTAWTLGYVAYDPAGRVIYFNEQTHPDLAYLVRRSVQELWGNPDERGKSGAYLEGIAMLIQGKKVKVCRKDNAKPKILDESAVVKDTNSELVEANIFQGFWTVTDKLCRTLFPVALIIYTICHLMNCLIIWSKTESGLIEPTTNLSTTFLSGMLIIAALFLILRWVAQIADRKASKIEAAKKLM